MKSPKLTQGLRKLNIGCGYDKREGYVNVDVDPACEPVSWFRWRMTVAFLDNISRRFSLTTCWNIFLGHQRCPRC